MSDKINIYSTEISKGEEKVIVLKKKLILISLIRLFFFIAFLSSIFYYYPYGGNPGVVLIILSITAFLISVKYYFSLKKSKQLELYKIEINKNEIEHLKHNFSMFEDGREFIDPNHINSYDLDLFGRGSVFQFINRTVTFRGKEQLASFLQYPILNSDNIKMRQELVSEMALKFDWRLNFSALGKFYSENKEESILFEKWGNETFKLESNRFTYYFLFVLPLFAIFSIVFWIMTGSSGLFVISTVFQAVYWFIEKNNIKDIYTQFGKRIQVLTKYEVLLNQIEQIEWTSEEGKNIHENLNLSGLPSQEIKKLRRIVTAFDNRNNMFAGLILNITFLWDIMCSYRLLKWHKKNQRNYKLWNDTIAFIDSINSISNYTFNHPEFNFADPTENEILLNCEHLGHPLIHPNKRKTNNFTFQNDTRVMIVTGANMSGKSTFLRTLGVNMVLAMIGAPVCAKKMEFKPIEVFSNMRTTDSLFDDESYFYAELKRLKAILDEIDKGRSLFIILDEILKGTNSVDKLSGSQKLVSRLINQNASAIIATHDLKLTEIEKTFPSKVKNNCFEIELKNDEMHFDYQLRNGVTTIMNATFLMKKMGIIN